VIPLKTLKDLSKLIRARQDWLAGNIEEVDLLRAQKEAEKIAQTSLDVPYLENYEGSRLFWLVVDVCTEKEHENLSLEIAHKTVLVAQKLGVEVRDICRRLIALPYKEYMSRLGS